MYIPKINGSVTSKEDAGYINSVMKQSKWDLFTGNVYLGARLSTTLGAAYAYSKQNQEVPTQLEESSEESIKLSQTNWKESEFYRDGLSYSNGMTLFRARLLSEDYDKIEYSRYLSSKSKGLGNGIVKFTGNLVGQVIDPINYIPFIGLGSKVLRLSRTGIGTKLAGTSLAKTVMKRPALKSAIEVGVATAAVEPFVGYAYGSIGEERTWQQVVADIALGAAFGAATSTIAGAIKRRINNKSLAADNADEIVKSEISKLNLIDRINKKIAYNKDKITNGKVKGKDKNDLIKTNAKLQEEVDLIEGYQGNFSQDVQINSTKAMANAVDSIIKGETADVGDAGVQAVSDIMRKYGSDDIPVSARRGPETAEVTSSVVEKEVASETVTTVEEPIRAPEILTSAEKVEFEDIDYRIKNTKQTKNMMSTASDCLFGT